MMTFRISIYQQIITCLPRVVIDTNELPLFIETMTDGKDKRVYI